MSVALKLGIATSPQLDTRPTSADWETPAGPVEPTHTARAFAPSFTYRGYGDPHWLGQTCHVVGAANSDERTIVLACGCQASVPWWTLEPHR